MVLNYMEAFGNGDHALAEKILHDIKTIEKLCRDSPGARTTD